MAAVSEFQRSEYAARLRAAGRGGSAKLSEQERGIVRQFLSRRAVLKGPNSLRGIGGKSAQSPHAQLQQSVVKVSYRSSKYPGQWEAHGKYLEREGAQQEGERGTGFTAMENEAVIASRLKAWQEAKDEHMFRLLISPEQGDRMDLREHTRNVLAQMERDLGTKLQWVAIDHNNTDNPHVHIALRGRDDKGNTLIIPKHYIQQGIRERSREEATRELGMRQEKDIVAAREKAMTAIRVTELDRILEGRRNGRGEAEVSLSGEGMKRETSRQLLGRLQFLRSLGMARKTGALTWKLSDNLLPALRQYQNSQDIVKRRAQHMSNIMDTRAPLAVTGWKELEARGTLTGRVVGSGLDDALEDRRYLLLEATDGRVHYMPVPKGMERRMGDAELKPGDLISLKVKEWEKTEPGKEGEAEQKKTIRYVAIDNSGKVNDRSLLPIDRDIVASAREGVSLHIKGDGLTRFQQHYNELVQDRTRHLQEMQVLDRQGRVNEEQWKHYRIPQQAKEKDNERDRER